MPATWTVRRTANARFPFRIAIEQSGKVPWAVRARDAWPGPGATVTGRKLPVGDYARVAGERSLAVVERKSFDNLLSETAAINGLHQSLAALAAYARAALVIEAKYADFLDPDRIRNWPVQHPPRVLGTLRDAGSLTTTGRARGVRYWRR
jgi:hypothetical protein